jgi:VWFA-related protein
MNRTTLALLLVLQLVSFTLAQQPSNSQQEPTNRETQRPQRPTEDDVVRITTNLVQVDAVVTDKNGKPVTDLGADEVELSEDGKTQKITNFSFVQLNSSAGSSSTAALRPIDKNAPPVPAVPLKPERVRRTIALVVDDLGLSFGSIYYIRQALKKFVEQQLQPDDLVAIIRTGGGIGALQQFTTDRRQLAAAIDRVKWNPTGRSGVGAFAPIAGDPLAGANLSGDDEANSASEDFDRFREDIFAVGTLGALNYVVRGLRELPGRKSVILLSDGIRILNRKDPSQSERVLQALRRLLDLANRASVVIYTIDARGLPTLGLTAEDSGANMRPDQVFQALSARRQDFFDSQDGLNYIAQQTGGLAIRNNNDLNYGIKRVIEDQQGYYLIGYRPDEGTFDPVSGRRKFHSLSLKVLRPGKFNVRMRNGFFGVTDEQVMPQGTSPQQQLIAALTSPFGASGVNVRLTSLFANDAKVGSLMRSFLYIKGSDLTFVEEPDGWHKTVFDVVAVTFGDNGIPLDQIQKTFTIRAKGKTYESAVRDGLNYNLLLPIKKPGAYQLRAAVRDMATSKVGSASQFVEVPDIKKNRLTLSGLLVNGMPLEVFKNRTAVARAEGDSDEGKQQVDPRASTVVRQFRSGYALQYYFWIYNAQLDKTTGKPQLQTQVRMFRNGEQVFAGKQLPFDPSEQQDLKRMAFTSAVSLGTSMVPGEYVLQVVVTDLLAKEKQRIATQWIDFEVVE